MTRGARYLLAVYILGHRDEPPVPTSAVAETLDRSPATVTETFRRLAATLPCDTGPESGEPTSPTGDDTPR